LGPDPRAWVVHDNTKLIAKTLSAGWARPAAAGARGGKAQGVLLNIMA
jgi:hypothetical protein